ncbi:restriction endonuclease subunit S [Shewanella sp.]|uniref:restriction endonuclease subunit S n=1 Tax=Shewanella sp. TaxID=50422 RepID=UPI00262DBA95|nr:restriction endonuclease subunit S [Shewanella sp.]
MSWSMVKLGDICDLQNGYAFKSSDYVDSSQTLSCRMSNIRPGGVFDIDYNSRFLPDDFATKYSQFMLNDGDVIIAMTDLADSPKILGVPTVVETSGRNILLNQRVGKLVIKDTSLIHFPYLKLALNYPKVREVYKRYAGGGLQINLGKADLLSVEIPLPPLAEQKRIAAILDKADAIRRKRQQAILLADDFLRAVFLEMFGDPVTNPKGWEVKKLGEMIVKGPTNGLYKPASDYGSGTRILRIDGFYDGVLSDQSKLKRVKITDAEMEKFGLTERSIVINRVNSKEYLGKCGFAQHIVESTVFESNMMNFKVDELKLNPRFLVQQLQMPNIKMQIKTCSKDAVNQSSINQNDVKSFEVIVPSIDLQNEYESVCKRFLASKTNYDDSSNMNGELFNSLSQKAFAGEL